jgi:hypothetical protein
VDSFQVSIWIHLHNNIRSHCLKTARWQRAENHADESIQFGTGKRCSPFRLKGGFLLPFPTPWSVEVCRPQLPELIETTPGGFVEGENWLQLLAPFQLLRR